MTKQPVRRVVFQPDSYYGIQRGINQMADVIRPTLGPLPRSVAVSHYLAHRTPELLDNGAVIAKRLVQLPDRDDDMGAMFLRHVLQHLYEKTGDGTATAAVLLQSVYNQGIRYVTAGGNAMKMRRYLQQGTWTILRELNKMAVRLKGSRQMAQVAEAICHDPPLASLMGEIFDIIGEYGRLEINTGHSRNLEREYIEGIYWDSELLSREMFTDHKNLRTETSETAILLSNLDINDVDQIIPVIEAAKQTDSTALLIIANRLSNEVISLLMANSKPDSFQIYAVRAPGIGHTKQTEALRDLVILTGGSVYVKVTGQQDLSKFRVEDLGRARRAWASRKRFGIIGGRGNPRALRQHIADLRAALRRMDDKEDREAQQERIGKLISGSAILKIGGSTNAEIRSRKEVALQTADAMRWAIKDGVLPGGGVSFLACIPVLQQKRDEATDTDERAAYGILIKAMEEPLRTIVGNAGYEPSEVMGQINLAGPCHGFDVITGRVVDVMQAGIYDAATVAKTAVQTAVASAALALTTEVLIHHKNPQAPAAQGPGAL